MRTKLQPGESSGLFKKTISKLSTEYRLQFVWPNVRRAIKAAGGPDHREDSVNEPPRKSLSMGALKAAQAAAATSSSSHHQALPTVHKKRTTNEREGARDRERANVPTIVPLHIHRPAPHILISDYPVFFSSAGIFNSRYMLVPKCSEPTGHNSSVSNLDSAVLCWLKLCPEAS